MEILGRHAELQQIDRFLSSVRDGPAALLFEGAAGIGKTTLWIAGADAARDAGLLVLATRAAESEARMSYTALSDLFEDSLEGVLPALVEPQRNALERALLRAGSDKAAPDPRAVALASSGAIRALAAERALIIAIDDVQWLDAPSARVLSFVVRRLEQQHVGVIASLRLGSGSSGDPLDLVGALPRFASVRVGALSPDVLGRLLRERTGADLPRPRILRIHRATHGNPLFALEVARSLDLGERAFDPGGQLPVPDDLQQLLSARLAALPAPARSILLTIAATTQPTVELVTSAAGDTDRAATGMLQAERAGVIERAGGRVRLSHPLLGSTVYGNTTMDERRALHLRLAGLMRDPEERARHLALAAEGPDTDVARSLDEAATHARRRGAPDAAAQLEELARHLTPGDDAEALRLRSLEAAEYHFDAGDAGRALALLRETIASSPPGRERAEMLYRLSSMSWMDLIHGVREPALQALEEAEDEPEVQSGAHLVVAWVAFYLGDLADALEHARKAVAFADDLVDPAARSDALATLGFVDFVLGHTAEASMAEALRLQDVAMQQSSWTEASVYTTPRSILGLQRMYAGHLDEARAIFEHELAEYERHAMYTVRQEVLCYLAELECRSGRWQRAAHLSAEAMETVVESGQTATQSHVVLFNQAYAAAHLGLIDDAHRMATDGLRMALQNDDAFNAAWNRAVLGFLALSRSDPASAHTHLEPVVRYLARMGAAEPSIIPCIPDEVEALVSLGELDEAERILTSFEGLAATSGRPWAIATAARCRGLLFVAHADLEGARASLDEAVEMHPLDQPFELARTLLVLGQLQRRMKKKGPARDVLERARDVFAELGAPLWETRASGELARVGGRPPSPLELTPTEKQIAELVAEGRTNREVADLLFVSPNTVHANLRRIFQKLGVRSRTELAGRVDRPAS